MKLEITKNENGNAENISVMESLCLLYKEQHLCSMSSVNSDKSPHINTAFYAFKGASVLYFLSEPNGLHTKNFDVRPKIAVNIAASDQKWGSELKGAQLFGTCCRVNAMKDLLEGYSLYAKRFLGFSDWIKHPQDLLSGAAETRLYKISILNGKLFDEVSFGKDSYIEFKFEKE